MTPYQDYIHLSRYARWRPSDERRETWSETVDRYVDFFRRRAPGIDWGELREAIYDQDVMPSMRSLMTAGPALERENIAGYNCCYVTIADWDVFPEILYILMCGTGVGFSVESDLVSRLAPVPVAFAHGPTVTFADSKGGWARGYREYLRLLLDGWLPSYDLSRIRPEGAPLRTFGGRASGPEPLRRLLEFTKELFLNARGRQITTLEAHDLACMIATCVVVGGVRRSALISLSDLHDEAMQYAKSGTWYESDLHRRLANNSAVYTSRPLIKDFLKEWTSLMDSGSGERGIFNRAAAQSRAAKIGRSSAAFGTNPCVRGTTNLLTDKGYFPIETLAKESAEVLVWNGCYFAPVTPFSTGINPIYRVNLSDGTFLDCTPYHKFILVDGSRSEAHDLRPGDKLKKFNMPVVADGTDYGSDGYSQGFYSGDGNEGYEYSWMYEPKFPCIPYLRGKFGPGDKRKYWKHGPMFDKTWVPVYGTLQYCLSWLAGLCDSDGTVTRDINGNGIQITSVNKDFLLRVRLMLSRLGVRAKVMKGVPAGIRTIRNQDWMCQQTWRLLIGNSDTYHLKQLGFTTHRLQIHDNPPQRDARQFVFVTSVEDLGIEEETFCVTEPKTNRATFNGIVTGNCGEILLRPYEFCNLTEVVLRPSDTDPDIRRKVRLASILGTVQSSLTSFNFIRPDYVNNCVEERLLGVSLTGIMDNILATAAPAPALSSWRKLAREVNVETARALGIAPAAAITCVKPSGTVSQLVDSASGIHPRWSPYYFRRVRATKTDPVSKLLLASGYAAEEDITDPHTWVFTFPQAAPSCSVSREQLTALDQLRVWQRYNEHWCDHNPSCTVYVRPTEWLQVASWVYDNFDSIGGLSFLPYSDHIYQQAPYEEVTKEVYDRAVAAQPPFDPAHLRYYEHADSTTSSQEIACMSGACML